jgi:hypothetical protein
MSKKLTIMVDDDVYEGLQGAAELSAAQLSLQELRRAMRLTQVELADRLGVRQDTISCFRAKGRHAGVALAELRRRNRTARRYTSSGSACSPAKPRTLMTPAGLRGPRDDAARGSSLSKLMERYGLPGWHNGAALVLTFEKPISGPIASGFACHCDLGLMRAGAARVMISARVYWVMAADEQREREASEWFENPTGDVANEPEEASQRGRA